jgi:hypothetical protein
MPKSRLSVEDCFKVLSLLCQLCFSDFFLPPFSGGAMLNGLLQSLLGALDGAVRPPHPPGAPRPSAGTQAPNSSGGQTTPSSGGVHGAAQQSSSAPTTGSSSGSGPGANGSAAANAGGRSSSQPGRPQTARRPVRVGVPIAGPVPPRATQSKF